MLGRKTFTADEIATARTAATTEVASWRSAVAAASGPTATALAELEPVLANQLALALDRPFVHRVRGVAGKDGNPCNELEVLVESLLLHGGIHTKHSVLKVDPATSVLGLAYGEPIALTIDQFEQLAAAFLAEVEVRFAE